MNKKFNTTIVIEAALDARSIKLKEKPKTHSLDAGHLS